MQNFSKIDLYEKRDFGEKINATFAFIRQNQVPLGKCLLFIAGPLLVIVGIINGMLPTLIQSGTTTGFIGGTALNGVFSLFGGALVIAVVHVYLERYMQQDGAPQEVADIWEGVKPVLLKTILAIIVTGLVVVLGFMFLIIPGFILLAALSLIFAVMTQEKLSVGDAFSRCFRLVSGNYLSTLLLIVVMIILQTMLGTIIGLPALLMMGTDSFFTASGEMMMGDKSLLYKVGYILAQVLNTLGNQLLSAITLVAIAFQYGNLVEKKESAGLMQDIDAIGNTNQSATDPDETF